MPVRIALAGRVGVEVDGVAVAGPGLGPLGRLVLAHLVLERRRPVPRDELAEVLWNGEPPRSWETSVRMSVAKVRAVLAAAGLPAAEVVTTEAGAYQFHLPEGAVVDLEAAARAVEEAARALAAGLPGAARRAVEAAVDVAGRQLLPGASGAWVERRQAEVRELHIRALELASEAAAGEGDWARAVGAAEEAIAAEPFRESAHVRLMAAHAGAGNRGEALRAYERARRLLADELGVDPSAPTQEAYVALLGAEPSPAPVPGPARAAPRLPLPLTSFVGREGAVAEVRRLLASTRLLSLTGTGGMGKTRLALEVAAGEAAAGSRDVALVELGPLADRDLVPQQVLSALGLSEKPGRTPTDSVVDQLRSRPTLLVLDNCEHLLGAAATLAERLLRSCPDLRVLATTREPLRVPGETTWRVPALATPEPGDRPSPADLARYDAARLFLDRATAVRPGLEVGEDDAAAVAQLVRRLDGIPLALELAAGRMAVMSVRELAERLDDRFRVLAGGSRTGPDRHRTLRAAVDWTYDALSGAEATLFARLAVFAGTFALDAAEQVCAGRGLERADVLGVLSGLVDKSLVAAEHEGGTTRYRLSETMRRYGQERLAEDPGEEAAQRDAHLAWAGDLAARAELALRGPDQARWLGIVESALDDVRAALTWGHERGDPAALALAGALGRFWEVRGYLSEGRARLEALRAAAGPAASPEVRAKALRAAGNLAQRQGDYEPARAFHAESLELATSAGDRRGVAAAVHGLGNLDALRGDLAAARGRFEQALEIGRALGDDHVVAAALTNLGTVAHNQAAFGEARAMSEQSLAVRRRMGDRHGIAMVTGNLAYLAFQQGERAEARVLYEESLRLQRELGDRPGIANSLCNLGYLALTEGDLGGAATLLAESLALAGELGDKYWTTLSLLRLAKVARAEGDHRRASALDARALTLASELGARRALAEWLEGLAGTAVAERAFGRAVVLLGAAQAVREEMGAPLPPAERPAHDQDLSAARAALGDAAFASAWDEGRAMPLEDAIRLGRDA